MVGMEWEGGVGKDTAYLPEDREGKEWGRGYRQCQSYLYQFLQTGVRYFQDEEKAAFS